VLELGLEVDALARGAVGVAEEELCGAEPDDRVGGIQEASNQPVDSAAPLDDRPAEFLDFDSAPIPGTRPPTGSVWVGARLKWHVTS